MQKLNYKISIGVSKQTRIQKVIEEIFEKIGYKLSFGRKGECIIGDIRFVQIKGVEQTSISLEYGDIDAFIVGSDIAEEVILNIENNAFKKGFSSLKIEELLDFEKAKSRFCLLVDKNKKINENEKLSKQFDFIITKYPLLAKKYIDENIVIRKSESDSELLAKRFGVISFEIVQSGETAKQNGLDILGETSFIDEKSYLGKMIKKFPKNSIKIYGNVKLNPSKKEILDDFVVNIKSVLDAQNYDLISFNIEKEKVGKILKIFPGRLPNILETNNKNYVTLRTLIKKYDISTITKIRKIGAKDILVEPLRQVY